MSKNVIIQESGIEKSLTVDVLRLPNLGGGTLDVVPADGKNLVKITVKQNGTYKASDFGAYGIAVVRVACTLNGGSATSEAVSKGIGEAFNPTPAEGGIARIFTAKRIETPLSGGGTCRWLRKSDVSLGTKSTNVDNTSYRAADDGYYGYSQVTVSGISITKTTDGDGNEVVEHTDGTGTETMIMPSSIALEPAPSFTGPYGDGAYIGFDGMVVKAYKGDGGLWTDAKHPNGIIPFEELILPVTVTDINARSEGIATSELVEGPVPFGSVAIATYVWGTDEHTNTWQAPSGGAIVTGWNPEVSANKIALIAGAKEAFQVPDYQYTHNGKTVHYLNIGMSNFAHYTKVSPPPAVNGGISVIPPQYIWTAIYGDMLGGGQYVPVQWQRPGDNEVLETSFTVEVVDVSPSGGGD